MTTRTCIGFVLSLALACSALAEPPVDAPRPHLLSHWLWTRNCPPTGCCPDDYCRKPLPTLLCPPLSPYLQCGPPNGPCATCGRHR